MASGWRLALAFCGCGVGAVGYSFGVRVSREAVDPSGASYRWGSGPERNGPLPPNDMILVPAGDYVIGDDAPNPAPGAPPRRVRLDAFYIDRHEVSNREFAHFVEVTDHVTTAEHQGGAWIYRGGERDWNIFVVQIGDIRSVPAALYQLLGQVHSRMWSALIF